MRYLGLIVRWVEEREPADLIYQGRIVYTEAPDEAVARVKLQAFADEHIEHGLDICVIPLCDHQITDRNRHRFHEVAEDPVLS